MTALAVFLGKKSPHSENKQGIIASTGDIS
jgi:hypothetical protein